MLFLVGVKWVTWKYHFANNITPFFFFFVSFCLLPSHSSPPNKAVGVHLSQAQLQNIHLLYLFTLAPRQFLSLPPPLFCHWLNHCIWLFTFRIRCTLTDCFLPAMLNSQLSVVGQGREWSVALTTAIFPSPYVFLLNCCCSLRLA